ncbi:MAG: MATE family efflux transporter [Clostridia bacterium]|nr:MATE family efflux transporter [Clostridia bacterium]
MRKNRVDLTTGPIFSKLLYFALPIFMGTIVTQLYQVADSMIVGRFVNADALAAVSAGSPIMNIINLFMIGMASGTGVIVAQHTGAKDIKALQESINTIGFITLVGAVGISIIGLLLCRPILSVLGTPDKIIRDSITYLTIIYIFNTGNMVYQMGNGILRGMGDSTWPFLFLLACSILNVILDLFTVLVLDMGVFGVALATGISQLISGVGVIIRINRGGYGVHLKVRGLKPIGHEARKILSIGLPASIQNVGNTIAAMFVQSSVNFFGPSFIAANSIVTKVDDLVNIPIMALSTALCTFVAQNMGLLQMDRIKKGINYCIISLTVVGIGLCGILLTFRNQFPKLFTAEPEVIAFASEGLSIMCFMCIFLGVDRCLVNAMRGAGKAVVPMITAQFGAFSRIPLSYLLGVRMNSHRGIFYALLIAAFLRMAAIGIYYYGGGWKKSVESFEKRT